MIRSEELHLVIMGNKIAYGARRERNSDVGGCWDCDGTGTE